MSDPEPRTAEARFADRTTPNLAATLAAVVSMPPCPKTASYAALHCFMRASRSLSVAARSARYANAFWPLAWYSRAKRRSVLVFSIAFFASASEYSQSHFTTPSVSTERLRSQCGRSRSVATVIWSLVSPSSRRYHERTRSRLLPALRKRSDIASEETNSREFDTTRRRGTSSNPAAVTASRAAA